MTEEWLPVTGWPYDVSSLGRVRSVPRVLADGRRAGGVVLKQFSDGEYMCVTLRNGGRRRTVRVHVLVAAAFHGPRPAGMQVLHAGDDHGRNDAGSLRYGTGVTNMRERVRRERKMRKKRVQVRSMESRKVTPESGTAS